MSGQITKSEAGAGKIHSGVQDRRTPLCQAESKLRNTFARKFPMTKKPPILKVVKSSSSNVTPPTRKLGRHGTVFWNTAMSEYQIADSGGLEILQQICNAIDRAESLAEQIDKDGEMIVVKGQLRPHPLLRDELANRAFVCRGLQRLGLNIEAIKPVGRPGGY
jgi:hypothetical protein